MAYLTDLNLMTQDWTSSKGNQAKWFLDGWWYKADALGYEGLAEYTASKLLEKSTFSYGFASYQLEKIYTPNRAYTGCKSQSFLNPGEELVTAEKLIRQYKGISIAASMARYPETKDRIVLLVDTIEEITGLKQFGEYLSAVLAFDALVLNDDRHTHNLAVVKTADGAYRYCPLFDYGASLLSDLFFTYPLECNVYDAIRQAQAKPFCRDFDEQLDAAEELYGNQFKTRFEKRDIAPILQQAAPYYDEKILRRVEDCLRNQLDKYTNLRI